MALPGFLWLGWVSLGACHKHVHVHPSLQDTIYTFAWVIVNLLATCDLS